jgi:hypothetical protein
MGQWIPNIVSASRLSSFSSPLETARSDVNKSLTLRWFHLFDDFDPPPIEMALRYMISSALLAVVVAQTNVGDPVNDFCRRHLHQTCIVDNKLYIDGGKIYYGGSVDNGSVAEQSKSAAWSQRNGYG